MVVLRPRGLVGVGLGEFTPLAAIPREPPGGDEEEAGQSFGVGVTLLEPEVELDEGILNRVFDILRRKAIERDEADDFFEVGGYPRKPSSSSGQGSSEWDMKVFREWLHNFDGAFPSEPARQRTTPPEDSGDDSPPMRLISLRASGPVHPSGL